MVELMKIAQTYLGFNQTLQKHHDREFYETVNGIIVWRNVYWRRRENGLEREERKFWVYSGDMSKEEIRDNPALAIDYEKYAQRLRDWDSEGRN